jgi:hypothetical protein
MRKRRLRSLLIVFAVIIISGYFIFKPAFRYLSEYLSKSEQVKANILLVEGWLPDNALDLAKEEFQKKNYTYIVTTGLKSPSDFYLMSSNGKLIFNTKNYFKALNQKAIHTIEVDAFSDLGGENRAHFNLYINQDLIGEFLTEKRKKTYMAKWKGILNTVDSVIVQYDNDMMGYSGDRNLFIRQIRIDQHITIPFLYNSEYDVINYGKKQRVINNYTSNAELTRNKLMALGIDSTRIITTAGESARINRTLTSALAFRDWLKTSGVDVKGINIISLGTHARRTWMTYNKVLNEKYDIGIISVPEPVTRHSRENKLFKTVRESLGIIYYWIILNIFK